LLPLLSRGCYCWCQGTSRSGGMSSKVKSGARCCFVFLLFEYLFSNVA
jgi:hypothetical protein